MSTDQPAGDQNIGADTDQPGERLDADKVPEDMPERPHGAFEHGTTVTEQQQGESLEDRLAREHPDTAPPPEPTATPLADDSDDGIIDKEKDLVSERPVAEPHADDSGHPSPDAPAEQAAVRIEEGEAPGAVDRVPIRPEDDETS